MNAAVIRRAEPSDAAALAEFCARTFRETYEAFNTEADMALHLRTHFSEEIQRREIGDGEAAMLIAEQDRGFAAYAKLRRGEAPACVHAARPVEVQRFYVDGPWQGTGLAYRLMDAARRSAVAMGADALWLGVWERNPRAIAFYKKCGFGDMGAWTFTLGNDVQNDRILQSAVSSEQ